MTSYQKIVNIKFAKIYRVNWDLMVIDLITEKSRQLDPSNTRRIEMVYKNWVTILPFFPRIDQRYDSSLGAHLIGPHLHKSALIFFTNQHIQF